MSVHQSSPPVQSSDCRLPIINTNKLAVTTLHQNYGILSSISYLFILQVLFHVFKVVVSWSLVAIEVGELLSSFVTESNLFAIGIE